MSWKLDVCKNLLGGIVFWLGGDFPLNHTPCKTKYIAQLCAVLPLLSPIKDEEEEQKGGSIKETGAKRERQNKLEFMYIPSL